MAESTPFIDTYTNENRWNAEEEKYQSRSKRRSDCFLRNWKDIALAISIISTLVLAVSMFHNYFFQVEKMAHCNNSLLGPELDTQRWIPNRWVSDYSSADASGMEEVDKNWNAIRAAHGIVAVDHQWAAENRLPLADSLPSDNTKGVYTIEAYHSIHCLVVIRRTMFQLARGQPLDVPFGHSTHCIDAVRQSIMCSAADTLLYKRYNVSDGDGQVRKCRNWHALRDWAGENSACYLDSEEAIAAEEKEGCDLRTSLGDGILIQD